MSRLFTLREAEKLLPQIRQWMREAVSLKTDYDDAERALQLIAERITLLGGSIVDTNGALEAKQRRRNVGERLQSVLQNVQETGCLVKDLEKGLVDFPTLFHGQEVYLCWKLDETSIGFWHGIQEGFAGRKAIDRDFLDHHQGEKPQ
jgi:hypothetical protein